ncbi:sensor histidine kinase [Kocuria rosea]|uniref:histidine kinase n=1 Tax=Kocuria rosea TaxID=1275 RepID=A0A4R5YP84_KOCRO|nr:histidine kinase [Kocuria rosea]TDL46969.1 two-component sensor histidine kinase [Kocuria rosea]
METALDSVLAYAAIGMLATRATWASLVSWGCLAFSLRIDEYPMAALTACTITVAVVATTGRRFVVLHLVGYGLWILLSSLKHPESSIIFWSLSAVTLVGALIGAAVRYFRAQRRRSEQRVRDLEVLNERLREDERQALARDLHDVVAHELTLITMQTMSRRRSGDVGELHQVLETVEDAARSALHELRVMLRLLRDENDGDHFRDVTGAGLAIGSLDEVVRSLAASLRDLRFEPEVVLTGDLEAMPTTVRGTSARILQESVTNIIKYAPAGSRCRIEVAADEHELRLRVVNPLPRSSQRTGDHSSELSSGLGLRGIAERVSLLGGHAKSGPQDGQWVLDVCLPVDGREAL